MGNELAILEAEAMRGLSNFDGSDSDYDGYDGFDDDFVDFNGIATHFGSEKEAHKIFVFSISNKGVGHADCSFKWMQGYRRRISSFAVGQMTEGQFNAIGGVVPLTGAGKQATIDEFIEYCMYNPLRVLAFKISTDTATNIDNMVLQYYHLSPFQKTQKTEEIIPANYVDENTYRDKVVTVTKGFDLNNQIYMEGNIDDNSKVTFTLFCGGSLNTAKALSKKRNTALRNIAVAKNAGR